MNINKTSKPVEVAFYGKRVNEAYPLQRLRVYAQTGIGMDGKMHPERGEGLSDDGTIAFARNALDAWDYARRAGLGTNGFWASEWVLLNQDQSYVKTKCDPDYVLHCQQQFERDEQATRKTLQEGEPFWTVDGSEVVEHVFHQEKPGSRGLDGLVEEYGYDKTYYLTHREAYIALLKLQTEEEAKGGPNTFRLQARQEVLTEEEAKELEDYKMTNWNHIEEESNEKKL